MNDRSSSATKSSLRNRGRNQRRSLSPDQRTVLDSKINKQLVQAASIRSAVCVAAYSAFDGEPDILPAMRILHERGQAICLPVIGVESGTMQMKRWKPGTGLTRNRLGIGQPDHEDVVPLAEIDVVLIPLVAWDNAGNRLGMGAGYYDRYLSPVAASDRPLRVGVAYQAIGVESIPVEIHDVRLHALITDSGWQSFNR